MSKNTKISSNKSFGVVFFIVFLIIGFYPLLNNQDIRIWSLIVSFIFLILGYLNSNLLTPLNIAWNKIGIFLGIIISPIVLGVIFFLIVTPTSLLMRLFQKDLLNLKYNKNKSYWIIRQGPKNKMKNQF